MGDARSVYRETDNAGNDIVVDLEQRSSPGVFSNSETSMSFQGFFFSTGLSLNF